MKTFKYILIGIFFLIEISSIILFITGEINTISFILFTSLCSLMVGLLFMSLNKRKLNSDKEGR